MLQIVDFKAEHLNGALEVLFQSNLLHTQNNPAYFCAYTPEDARPYLQDVLDNSDTFGLIALEHDKVAGILMAGIEKRLDNSFMFTKYYKVYDLAVDEKFRGQGIGALLNNTLKQKAKQNHISNIELDVFLFNQKAMKFYEKLGYQELCKTLFLPIDDVSNPLS